MVNVGGVSGEYLRSYIERVERLEEEKKAIADDIKEVFAEAKGNGFDTKTIRQILKIRKMDASELEEQDYLLDTYKRALGMLPELDEDVSDAPKEAAAFQLLRVDSLFLLASIGCGFGCNAQMKMV